MNQCIDFKFTWTKGSSEILSSLWSLSFSLSSKLLPWNIYILIFFTETTGANFDNLKVFFRSESRGPNVPKENVLPMFYEQILPSYYGVRDKRGQKETNTQSTFYLSRICMQSLCDCKRFVVHRRFCRQNGFHELI